MSDIDLRNIDMDMLLTKEDKEKLDSVISFEQLHSWEAGGIAERAIYTTRVLCAVLEIYANESDWSEGYRSEFKDSFRPECEDRDGFEIAQEVLNKLNKLK